MTASRRLQLAAEKSGVLALALRRTGAALADPTAAVSRWRVAALPSTPLPVAGLGRPRWRIELTRCRAGGEPATWIAEGCDAQGRLGLVADLADRSPAADEPRRRAAAG
jgi:protein ImuA